jgi:hypothetical protein
MQFLLIDSLRSEGQTLRSACSDRLHPVKLPVGHH